MSANDIVSSTLRILITVFFLGWILIWILMPTDVWSTWKSSLDRRTYSTYFGRYGANLLLYTFPVMLIGVLGCVYLHLAEKKKKTLLGASKGGRGDLFWRRWNRPVLVRGPLGVVRLAELAFAMLFLALLIWIFSTYCVVGLPSISSVSHSTMGHDDTANHGTLWQAKLRSMSKWIAYSGVLCTAFLFFPVTRTSVVLKVAGLSFEEAVRYHMWLGHLAMVIFTVHGTGYVIGWASQNKMHEMLTWVRVGTSNLAGELSWFFGFCMWVSTLPWIRTKKFELFFYTHQLYVLFIIFYFFHVGANYIYMFLPGVFLFTIDRCLRFLQSRQPARLLLARLLPCHVMELTFAKTTGLEYNPMSIVFINIPSISPLQWHPFTVVSDSSLEQHQLSVIIKSEGDWSESLFQKLASEAETIDRLHAVVEGPYEHPTMDILRHKFLIMISGGGGITPFFSLIRHVVGQKKKVEDSPRLLMVCAFKNSPELTVLDLLLPAVSGHITSSADFSSLQLEIEAYVTRDQKEESPGLHKNNTRTIWFEGSSRDSPVCGALGRSKWLWMGAVVSASFLLFLLFLGVFTRFYTYPKERDTALKYSYPTWLRAMFMIIFMFVSVFIVVVGTAAMRVICRIECGKEAAMEGSEVFKGKPDLEKEMESFPRQWLAANTKVKYGTRPNFTAILGRHTGESSGDVGVMVCGPNGMREDVAAVCSTSSNLHFHAVNFDW